ILRRALGVGHAGNYSGAKSGSQGKRLGCRVLRRAWQQPTALGLTASPGAAKQGWPPSRSCENPALTLTSARHGTHIAPAHRWIGCGPPGGPLAAASSFTRLARLARVDDTHTVRLSQPLVATSGRQAHHLGPPPLAPLPCLS